MSYQPDVLKAMAIRKLLISNKEDQHGETNHKQIMFELT
jgi:hypothetical protein